MRLLLWQVMARRVAGTGSGCSIRFTIRPVSRYAFRSSWVTLRASSQTVRINSPSVVRIVLVLVVMGNTSFYGFHQQGPCPKFSQTNLALIVFLLTFANGVRFFSHWREKFMQPAPYSAGGPGEAVTPLSSRLGQFGFATAQHFNDVLIRYLTKIIEELSDGRKVCSHV